MRKTPSEAERESGHEKHKNPKEREGADERRVKKKIERSKIKYQRQKENNLKNVRVRTSKTNAKSYMCIQTQAYTHTHTHWINSRAEPRMHATIEQM